MTVDQARALFPHTAQGKIYMNHAGTSPLSTRVVKAMTDYLHQRSEGRIENYQHDLPMVAECKSMITRLINAESPDRIALTANTSDGLNIIAGGIKWKSGDRILLGDFEFPANVWPYLNLRRLGVQIDFISSEKGEITPDQITRHIGNRTRIVAISAVQFLSGFRADLATIADLCQSHGALLIVDGIQAVGAVRIDVRAMKIDALAAGGQKWQTSPHGSGFLYLTETLQQQLDPAYLGWLAVENPWHFSDFEQLPASTARRFEGGSLNMPGLWGYHAALSTLLEFGTEEIHNRIESLTGVLLAEFQNIPGVRIYTQSGCQQRAGIITIIPDARLNAETIFKRMLQHNLTPALRQGMLRFSPHFYMTEKEMETAVGITRECLREMG